MRQLFTTSLLASAVLGISLTQFGDVSRHPIDIPELKPNHDNGFDNLAETSSRAKKSLPDLIPEKRGFDLSLA
jgi:hypothetical protein